MVSLTILREIIENTEKEERRKENSWERVKEGVKDKHIHRRPSLLERNMKIFTCFLTEYFCNK